MEEQEEKEQPLKNYKKPKRIVISRKDTLMNDLKNSTTEGLVSLIFAVVSLVLIFLGVFLSYKKEGKAGYFLGILMIVSMISAVISLVLSGKGYRVKDKSRHYMEKRGAVLSVISLLLLLALFVRGLMIYLAR